MKNKKRNTIITIIVVAIILFAIGIFFSLNYGTEENGLSILEKKWITDHANSIVDVNVYNDIPVYGYNGNGMIFDYLDYITEHYGINFNKISYYTESELEEKNISFQVLNNDANITNQDILLYEDHYVILGNNTNDNIELENITTLGVLKNDKELISNYLGENIQYTEYDDIEALLKGLEDKTVSNIVLANNSYMAQILSNELDIVYHIQDLKKKYILRVKDETTYSIMKKTYEEYLQTDYKEDYSKNYLNLYFTSTNTSDLLKKNYNAKTYKYGYVVNMPFENYVNGEFVGTFSNYLLEFESLADVEIEAILYSNIDDLKSAIVSGEIDFALGNFNYENLNIEGTTTGVIQDLEYLVLSKQEFSINSIKGLDDHKINVVAGSLLYDLCADNGLETNVFKNTDELIRNIDDNSIVLMDKETYVYYKDTRLKEYKIINEGVIKNGYRFLMNSQNEPFNSIFKYYISSKSYNTIKYQYHTDITLDKDYTMIKVIVFIIALIVFLVTTVILINRKNVTNTVISKEELLKYIDPMTSLKNRNYLNMNIYKWDDNVIFPQSVVVLDIVRLREINDTFGREMGDEIINKVASILINNQLENTDIVRSGGDEFLIYMVGYEEKRVSEYMKKMVREMKNIPNCEGVEVGYSMILDEVKTVDDAINEAIIMMMKNKEKKKNKEKE